MRWTVVFLFLYFIPILVLFKNYKSLRRSCIYGSIYVVLVTTIVTMNIYVSGLNKIEEAMYYRKNYVYNTYEADSDNTDLKTEEVETNKEKDTEIEIVENDDANAVDNLELEKDTAKDTYIKTDEEAIYEFKKDIYEIELMALIPMRECMPYTKDIAQNLKKLGTIKEDVEYAKEMCNKVISTYENMEVPTLSVTQNEEVLEAAKEDVKIAYELRQKAMQSSIELIDTKNPKYIGEITEYLNLSDSYISSFKEKLQELNYN